MELELEQSQQGSSHEVSVSTEGVQELKRIVRIKGVKTFRVILFSIHSDEWKSFQSQHQTALRLFDQDGKLVAPSNSESQFDCSNGDNACTSNTLEPKNKRFPNSTSLLGRLSRFVYGASTQVVPST
nr:hypothetical protein [Tanacetum cinerariifolium]